MDGRYKWNNRTVSKFLEDVKTGKIVPSACGHDEDKKGPFSYFSFPEYSCDIHVHWKDKEREEVAVAHIKDLSAKDKNKQYPTKIVDTYTIAMLRHFSGLDEKGLTAKHTKSFRSKGNMSLNQEIRKSGSKNNSTTNKNFNIMGNVQSYQVILEQLEELRNYLNRFKEEMQEGADRYQNKLNLLMESGLPIETYNKFQSEHLDLAKNGINQISNLIDNQSIPYISDNIEQTIHQLERNR